MNLIMNFIFIKDKLLKIQDPIEWLKDQGPIVAGSSGKF